MVHVTCLAHSCHRDGNFPDMDKLIGNMKNTFMKLPFYVKTFESVDHGSSVSPAKVFIRWKPG